MSLPRCFYKTNENGCRGFTEWGFMSTTSDRKVILPQDSAKRQYCRGNLSCRLQHHDVPTRKFPSVTNSAVLAARRQVAIKYSGVKDSQALPMVLVIRTGAVDRGACVRDFSQYVDEVEYLWLPGSFLEQVRNTAGLVSGHRFLVELSSTSIWLSGAVNMLRVKS